MGDHFVLLVDRLITESTLEAAIESQNQAQIKSISASSIDPKDEFAPQKNAGDRMMVGKLVECRICQDEDEDSNMETPCSCCGSLKYAHRKCVQRWCNEKGDTMCEICLQQFKPGYTAPPKLFHYGSIPMNLRCPLCSLSIPLWMSVPISVIVWSHGVYIRENWEISHRDIHSHRFITMVASDRDFVGSSDYDDYSSSSTRSIMYCRSIAMIFMVLLILRHALPIIISGAEQYSLTLFTLLLLRTAGIVLPLYIMLRAVTTFHRRRLHQETHESSIPSSDGENSRSLQPMQTA